MFTPLQIRGSYCYIYEKNKSVTGFKPVDPKVDFPSMNEQETAEIQKRSFGELLQNPEAVGFVNSLIKDSYQVYFQGHKQEVGEMVDKAWGLLVENSGGEGDQLKRTVKKINSEIFRKQDPTFWFNVIYKKYKTEVRPQKDFTKLEQFIKGKRVLDFGSGGGYVALLMSQNGYEVSTTDVIDYRVAEAKHLPFKAMVSPTDIPYPDDSFDTTIIKAVLHHIDPSDLPVVIKELRRVSKRLIIEEDTFDLPNNLPEFQQLLDSQPQLRRFTALSSVNQLQALMLMDYFANAIAQGVVEMNFPFQFKSIQQWQKVLEKYDLNLTEVKFLGFQDGNVNKSCHVWLVIDRK